MKKLILIILLSSAAWAQSFYRLPTPFPNATLYVCPVPSGGNPCPTPVSIYQDQGLTQLITQPVTLGSTGTYGFWTNASQFTLQVQKPYNVEWIAGGGGGSSFPPASAGGQVLASNGPGTTYVAQSKQVIDIRDVSGVDCTGATDSSTALNGLTNTTDTVSDKTLSFRGCPLIRLASQWLIHGQENLEIDLGNAQKPDEGTAITGNTLIFGCAGAAGAVVKVDRSGYLTLHGGGITAKGNTCTSSFTESLEFTNSGVGGYTSTHNHVSNMYLSPNSGGATIANYVGAFINAGPNQEMFDFKNVTIFCNNSTGSTGFKQTSPNSDSTTLHDGFMVSKCYYGVDNENGGVVRIRYANMTSNGNFTVFGTGGAAVRGPVQEMSHVVIGDGSGPLQVAAVGSQNGGYFEDNQFGASTADIDPTSYYMTEGPNITVQLRGNIFDAAGAGTCTNLNASTIIGPGGSGAVVIDHGANQKKASCKLWVNSEQNGALTHQTYIDVRDYGAVPDGATNNATAIAAAFTAANAVTTGSPTVYFGCNAAAATCQYSYGGAGVSAINPIAAAGVSGITIQCAPYAQLNYTGTAHAIDLGPTGLTNATVSSKQYTVRDCTFVGGGTQTAGIFVNQFVTQARIIDNQFINFGNTSAADIKFDQNAWDPLVLRNVFADTTSVKGILVDANPLPGTNLNINGIYSDNQVYCLNGASNCAAAGQPVGFILSGSNPIFSNNVTLGHMPILRLVSNGAQVEHNTLNGSTLGSQTTPAITFGDPGAAGANWGCESITDNTIFWQAASGISEIGVETPTSGTNTISGCTFKDNTMSTPTGASSVYINTNTGLGNLWLGRFPGNSTGLTPTHPLFDTAGRNFLGAYWEQPFTGAAFYQLKSPNASASSSLNFGAINATATYTQLNTNSGGNGVNLGIAGTDYWRLDATSHNIIPQVDAISIGGPTVSVNSISTAIHGAAESFTSAPCETADAATTINVAGVATTTGLTCLPSTAIIDAVVYRITTSIGVAASFTVGDGTTAARFCGTQSTLTVGTTGICFVQADQTGAAGPRQTTAAAVVVTFNVTPNSGAMRLHVFYHTWTPPTS